MKMIMRFFILLVFISPAVSAFTKTEVIVETFFPKGHPHAGKRIIQEAIIHLESLKIDSKTYLDGIELSSAADGFSMKIEKETPANFTLKVLGTISTQSKEKPSFSHDFRFIIKKYIFKKSKDHKKIIFYVNHIKSAHTSYPAYNIFFNRHLIYSFAPNVDGGSKRVVKKENIDTSFSFLNPTLHYPKSKLPNLRPDNYDEFIGLYKKVRENDVYFIKISKNGNDYLIKNGKSKIKKLNIIAPGLTTWNGMLLTLSDNKETLNLFGSKYERTNESYQDLMKFVQKIVPTGKKTKVLLGKKVSTLAVNGDDYIGTFRRKSLASGKSYYIQIMKSKGRYYRSNGNGDYTSFDIEPRKLRLSPDKDTLYEGFLDYKRISKDGRKTIWQVNSDDYIGIYKRGKGNKVDFIQIKKIDGVYFLEIEGGKRFKLRNSSSGLSRESTSFIMSRFVLSNDKQSVTFGGVRHDRVSKAYMKRKLMQLKKQKKTNTKESE